MTPPRRADKRRAIMLQNAVDTYGPRARRMVAEMLARQRAFAPGFVCFYHACRQAVLLYELQAVLTEMLGLWKPRLRSKELPPPVPRLRRAPFEKVRSIEDLQNDALVPQSIDDFDPYREQHDHTAAFRGVAISVTCSLFNPIHTEAATLDHLREGYNACSIAVHAATEALLTDCGIPGELHRFVTVANKHGLSYSQAGDGYIMQIFIRQDVLAQYAYSSQPYGIPRTESPLDFSEGTQARLYVPPSLTLDASRCRIFANRFDPPDWETKGRPALHAELKATLIELGFNPEHARARLG